MLIEGLTDQGVLGNGDNEPSPEQPAPRQPARTMTPSQPGRIVTGIDLTSADAGAVGGFTFRRAG